MNIIYYFLIPVGITAIALGTHKYFQYRSWQRELRNDERKKIEVDRLLAVDLDDWYNKEYSN